MVRIHPQLSFHFKWGKSSALCNNKRTNHEVVSHREKDDKQQLLIAQMSTFDIQVELRVKKLKPRDTGQRRRM